MDRHTMTNEENYFFDVAGYLIIRSAINKKEVERLNQALDKSDRTEGMLGWPAPLRDPFRELLIQPVLTWHLNQLCGYGFKLDTLPELIHENRANADGKNPLVGGNEPRNSARAYSHQNDRRTSQTVRAVWALSDVNAGDGGFVLVPGSHKSNAETPRDILTGADDMGLTLQPVLKAGDLVLIGGAMLQGLRSWKGANPLRLLSYEYTGRGVIQSAGTGSKTEAKPHVDWADGLTEIQQASLYKPGYQSITPPPALVTDGKTIKLDRSGEIFHPGIYERKSDSLIDEKEFYFWDLTGYLVLRNVMDKQWLEEANNAIDSTQDKVTMDMHDLARGSKSIAGTSGRPRLRAILELPNPYCDPFHKMIAHPVVEHRLNWMAGSGNHLEEATSFLSEKGGVGNSLHGGNEPQGTTSSYFYQNGRSYCSRITLQWQLRDVHAGDGGFACVPGSHKANYPLPEGVRTCDDHLGLVIQPPMNAGDVLFFMDGPQTHGAFAWKSEIARRCILIRYDSRTFHRHGGEMVHPHHRWDGDTIEDMTDAQLAVMRGADRDNGGANVPRLLVENGEVTSFYERGKGLYSRETPEGPLA